MDYSSWEDVLGRHGVGKINDNGLLLPCKCAEHSLWITNTLFRMADKYKTTWMHPRSKNWHLIYFIIVRQRDIRNVRDRRWVSGQTIDWSGLYWRCTLTAPRKPNQECQGRLQCRQAEGPILPGTIPASARRSCDHRRQHWEMDLFQRNRQWDCEGIPWSEDQNPWRLVRWEWRRDQRSHTCQEQVLHRVT